PHILARYPLTVVLDDFLHFGDGLLYHGFAAQIDVPLDTDTGTEVVYIKRTNSHPFPIAGGQLAMKHISPVFINLTTVLQQPVIHVPFGILNQWHIHTAATNYPDAYAPIGCRLDIFLHRTPGKKITGKQHNLFVGPLKNFPVSTADFVLATYPVIAAHTHGATMRRPEIDVGSPWPAMQWQALGELEIFPCHPR